ncbi:MAG: hypothetical protein ACJ79S_04190, partial [Gemmatimonadaceae bacterium]
MIATAARPGSGAAPSRGARVGVAGVVGAGAALLCWSMLRMAGPWAGDFTYTWRGARALAAGLDPYQVVRVTGAEFPFNYPLYYPLTAVVAALPFSFASPHVGAALFFGLSSALLAHAVTRDGWHRLPLFGSMAFFYAAMVAQWSPLLTAAAITPWLWFLLAVKPNLGFALAAYRPSPRGAAAALAFVAFTLVLVPGWPREWLHNVRGTAQYAPPVLTTLAGPLLLLAALRWRRPEGRLLLVLACVPQSPILYEALPLFLIPRTRRESLLLAVLTHAAFWVTHALGPHPNTFAYVHASGPVMVAFC